MPPPQENEHTKNCHITTKSSELLINIEIPWKIFKITIDGSHIFALDSVVVTTSNASN